jgi:hypothetical protein
MDQNQTNTPDDDLQKAIDNITNTTNTDPVFSDPVAAPSSIPEGDNGQLDEPVGPFPAPEPELPAPEMPPLPVDNPAAGATPEMPAPDAPATEMPPIPAAAPEMPPAPAAPAPEITHLSDSPLTASPFASHESSNLDMSVRQIKESALRDLIPLLERLNIDPEQKFGLYRNIFEELKDYSVLNPAYAAAKNITNDTERAEALLYLIESIDKM